MSYYAVKKGRIPGIYITWSACEEQVKSYPGASFKKFTSYEEAQMYMKDIVVPDTVASYTLWTDGSAYLGKSAGYAYVFVDPSGKKVYEHSGKVGEPFTSPHAEIVAICEGISAYIKYFPPGSRLVVKSDCDLAVKTINDWGRTRTPERWATSAYGETLYALYSWFSQHPEVAITHIPSHSGLEFNERCDVLAKAAAREF